MSGEIMKQVVESMSGAGTPCVECCCGLQHLAIDSDYLDEGEADLFHAKFMEKPNDYVEVTGCDSLSFRMIGGRTLVTDCPCKWWDRLANTMDAVLPLVGPYLKALQAKAQLELDTHAATISQIESGKP